MTHELEKLQRKGTKPTRPNCHATVLSTSQPNLMGTTPEMQKMYDQFGGEPVAWRWRAHGAVNWVYDPTPEWLLEHQDSIEAEPLFAALAATPANDAISFIRIIGEELINAGMPAGDRSVILANIRSLIAATPAVGGEAAISLADHLAGLRLPSDHADRSFRFTMTQLDMIIAALRAAPPASPLRGRDLLIVQKMIRGEDIENAVINAQTMQSLGAYIEAALSATPPEQPAAACAPMLADISQIISDGWKSGMAPSEVAEQILREFGDGQ